MPSTDADAFELRRGDVSGMLLIAVVMVKMTPTRGDFTTFQKHIVMHGYHCTVEKALFSHSTALFDLLLEDIEDARLSLSHGAKL